MFNKVSTTPAQCWSVDWGSRGRQSEGGRAGWPHRPHLPHGKGCTAPPSRVPADHRAQLHPFEYGQRSLSTASSQATRSPPPTQLPRQQTANTTEQTAAAMGSLHGAAPKTKEVTLPSGARKLGKKTSSGIRVLHCVTLAKSRPLCAQHAH